MNERLPYEEQLANKLADIPLPVEDMGWEAMRKMLEDDADDGVVPPPANTGCRKWLLGGLLLLLIAGITFGVYKMVQGRKGEENAKNSSPGSSDSAVGKGAIAYPGTGVKNDKGETANVNNGGNSELPDSLSKAGLQYHVATNDTLTAKSALKFTAKRSPLEGVADGKKRAAGTNAFGSGKKMKAGVIAGSSINGKTEVIDEENIDTATEIKGKLTDVVGKKKKHKRKAIKDLPVLHVVGDVVKTQEINVEQIKHPPLQTGKKGPVMMELLEGKITDLVVLPQQVYFTTGIAMQQLIPVDGQKASPYNAFGRKGSLGDYIPSFYFRLHHNKKFLQVEFKYGAPQYTKDIAYSTKIISYDSTTQTTSSTVSRVNKTYYHQVPVSIHYNVLPGLQVGAGAVWNHFQSAVVTQQGHRGNAVTGADSLVSSKIIDVKSDSAFAKTYWQFMLETQYQWKRFSFGARYAWGITPYITYTTPTGQTKNERNASLNLFIRYDLWSSKKK
jgi:hypothetical protein